MLIICGNERYDESLAAHLTDSRFLNIWYSLKGPDEVLAEMAVKTLIRNMFTFFS